jgi:hypothetical protein
MHVQNPLTWVSIDYNNLVYTLLPWNLLPAEDAVEEVPEGELFSLLP